MELREFFSGEDLRVQGIDNLGKSSRCCGGLGLMGVGVDDKEGLCDKCEFGL